jgi:hypothetical protein
MKLALCTVILFGPCILFAQDISKALVEIYSTRAGSSGPTGNSGSRLGAGTFISADGDILTAYHVVQGANTLEVYSYSTREKCADVRLLRYDETRDLAVLNCKFASARQIAYALIGEAPTALVGRKGEALGFPDGKPFGQVSVDFLQNTPISGEDYLVNGKQLFTQASWNVRLLNIDATLPPGMSGGPVVVNERVIAVVSGSEEIRARAPGWAMLATDANANTMKVPQQSRRFDLLPPLSMIYDIYLKSKLPLLKITFAPALAAKLSDLRSRTSNLHEDFGKADAEFSQVKQTIENGILLPSSHNELTQLMVLEQLYFKYFTEDFNDRLDTSKRIIADSGDIDSEALDSFRDPISRIIVKKVLPLSLPPDANKQKIIELTNAEFAERTKSSDAIEQTLRQRTAELELPIQKAVADARRTRDAFNALLTESTITNGVATCSNCDSARIELRNALLAGIDSFRILISGLLLELDSSEKLAVSLVAESADLEASAPDDDN